MAKNSGDKQGVTETQRVSNLYALYIAAIFLQFFPYGIVALFGFFLFICVLAYSYVLRRGEGADSLVYNHATFLIRTTWIASLIVLVTSVAGIAMLIFTFDPAELQQLAHDVIFAENIMEALRPYHDKYFYHLLMTNIVCVGPGVIYVGYRFAAGLMRALKGYRIANPHSWL